MNVASDGAHFISVGNVIAKLFKLWCHKLVSIVFRYIFTTKLNETCWSQLATYNLRPV
jgi:hypothetical protein